MKSLLKIYGKYMATALVILFLLFVLNACVYIYIAVVSISPSSNSLLLVRNGIHEISKEVQRVPAGGEQPSSASEEGDSAVLPEEAGSASTPKDGSSSVLPEEAGSASTSEEGDSASEPEETGSVTLSEKGIAMLKTNGYQFAMVLSPEGDVIYEWQLPDELPRHYSLGEVAAFSRWYLKDYPVKSWRVGEELLVCGGKKNSLWKFSAEFPSKFMRRIPVYLLFAFLCNLLLVLLIILVIGYRFYRSLSPMAKGIDALARQEPVSLSEKGIISDLEGKLNRTSRILQDQKELIDKRDTARTDWISGVSHDIRTPLSMIMGYADALSTDGSLPDFEREQACIIQEQSIFIKTLIEDLNLTSRLEYHMQPLRLETFAPAPFLRELVASCLNQELLNRESGRSHELSLSIEEEVEGVLISGDRGLLLRALRNLITNSIRHNPQGCHIKITADCLSDSFCRITVTDDGKGIPEPVVSILNGKNPPSDGQPHIMGLRIVRQILLAHGGAFRIGADRRSVVLQLPLFKKDG